MPFPILTSKWDTCKVCHLLLAIFLCTCQKRNHVCCCTCHTSIVWLFVQLMHSKKHNMKDIYRPGLPYLRLLMYMIDELIKANLPDVYEHMVKYACYPDTYFVIEEAIYIARNFCFTLCINIGCQSVPIRCC